VAAGSIVGGKEAAMKRHVPIESLCAFALITLAGCGDAEMFARQPREARAEAGPRAQLRSDSSITARRLWSGSEFDGIPSPDGRLLLMSRLNGNVSILELSTGKIRDITPNGDNEKRAYYAAAFSPDGKQIGYVFEDWENDSLAIVIANADGSATRRVTSTTGENSAWLHGWSPDGESLLISRNDARNKSLHLVSLGTGQERQLKSFDWRGAGQARFSADGKYLLYKRQTAEREVNTDLFAIELQTGREQQLTRTPQSEHPIGMDANGRVYYHTVSNGSATIWSAMLTTKGLSVPALLRSDIVGLSAAALEGGRIYYQTTGMDHRLYIASVDSRTAILSQPALIQRRQDARIASAAWSPEGDHLAFVLRYSTAGNVSGQSVGFVPLNAGEAREISLGPLGYIGSPIVWDEHGVRVVAPENGRPRVHSLDFATGAVEVMGVERLKQIGGANPRDRLSDDRGTVYFARWPARPHPDSLHQIVARELGGTERVVYKTPRSINPNLIRSPDGQSIAFIAYAGDNASTLEIIPISGGTARVVATASKPATIGSFQWTESGHLLFARRMATGEEIWRVPVTGGIAERVYSAEPGVSINQLVLSPDRRRLAFTTNVQADRSITWSTWQKNEFWVLDGLPTQQTQTGSRR
jgi:Tol biopolymer transport system component